MSTWPVDEKLDPLLTQALGRTIDFVKFAEAKNAALLTFATAATVAALNVSLNERFELADWPLLLTRCGFVMVVVGLLVAVFSFAPKIRPSRFVKPGCDETPPNLLFFGDVAQSDPLLVASSVVDLYFDKNGAKTDLYWRDLGCQIYINARIAKFKFNCFTVAAYVVSFGVLLYAISMLIFLWSL